MKIMASGSKKKIRTLHITFNMGIGGTEQVIRQLVSNLDPDRYCNSILCIDGQIGETGQQTRDAGIDVHTLKHAPGFDRTLVRDIKKLLRDEQIDLVHCHQYTPWLYGWAASLGSGARVIFSAHGRFHPERYRYNVALINPLIAITTSFVVAISDATRHALSRYEFIPLAKIRDIYNGISGLKRDPEPAKAFRAELGIPPEDFVMGTFARLDPVKNQVMMLEGFARVLRKRPKVWSIMVGDGPDRAMLAQTSHGLGIAGRTVFTGFKREPANYLAAMDLFLLTSHTEGSSITPLEAMSLGIPAVTTDVGGNFEIVNAGSSGILVPTNGTVTLAREIDQLMRNRELFQNMQVASRNLFDSRFSITPMINSYQSLYQRALRR
jgi:glycosyltransferase involved in cell wall biosynthesis